MQLTEQLRYYDTEQAKIYAKQNGLSEAGRKGGNSRIAASCD